MTEVILIRNDQGREETQNGREKRVDESLPFEKREEEEEKEINSKMEVEDKTINSFVKEKMDGENKGDSTKEEKYRKRNSVNYGRRKSSEGGLSKMENLRRGSLGRPQIKIPYLAQIERRISMDLLDYSGKMEGLKVWVHNWVF